MASEKQIIELFDKLKGEKRKNMAIINIMSKYGISEVRVTNVLAKHARIVPENCLRCKAPMDTHSRCIDCEILLHTGSDICGTCTLSGPEWKELWHKLND